MNKDTIEAIYPLSPMQEGMLFHSLYAPQAGVYVEQYGYVLQGELDVPAFKEAWQRVVGHHAALRTLFMWKNVDAPLQVVRREVELPWVERDWRGVPASEQERRLQAELQAERAAGFDLSRAPLLRFHLMRLSERTTHFTWSMHHVLLDGWSAHMALGQALACYEASQRGQRLRLPPSRPYRDYIVWLQRQDLGQAERFWRKALRGFTISTLLGVDKAPRGEGEMEPEPDYHEQVFRLPAATTKALQELAREHQLTLNTLIQGAWGLLLARYSGGSDVVFGVTVSGRPPTLAGVEAMVGLFINTLPVRVQIEAQEQLLPWLQHLQAQQAEAREYEYSPLVKVQGWSEVARGKPLFESVFVFENYPVEERSAVGESQLQVTGAHLLEATSFPLTLLAAPDERLLLRLSYMGSRFDAAVIHRMGGHLQTLLESMAGHPERRLAELPMLTEAERHQLLIEQNKTQMAYAQERCLHELFEAQTEATPDAIAIVFEEQALTYGELDCRANQLAHFLRHCCGTQTETLIGVAMHRTLEMMIGMLGILKAGAAYVPLDAEYPAERLAFILQDAQARVLITQAEVLERMPSSQQAEVLERMPSSQQAEVLERMPSSQARATARVAPTLTICLEGAKARTVGDDQRRMALEPTHAPRNAVVADNLAYTIYTSGSTGKPKGVQIAHGAVVNFLSSMRRQPGLTAQDTMLAVTSISFDIAGLELYLPLLSGARLVIASKEVARDGERLKQLIGSSGSSIMQATPTTWRMLLEVGWQNKEGVRLLCGGEALPPELARQLIQQGATLWNMYGPTETTIWSSIHHVESVEGPVPLGHAIGNTQIYLLDAWMEPVPMRVVGDLYIGGAGLSRGYLHRPDITAERFVPDPFSRIPGARLYKTGDLARYRSESAAPARVAAGDKQREGSATLEFLGRNDHQVKINGFRIELQEIETILEQHPAVRESVVIARADASNDSEDKRLVAYVVAQSQYRGATTEPGWQEEQVSQWQAVWDTTYGDNDSRHDAAFDLSGWRSSYTQEPIPETEMREWVSSTVERILALKPQRLLEIGCGTGLLLFQLAPHCWQYCGTDFSPAVLAKAREEVTRQGLRQVTLLEEAANDLSGIEAGVYDVIVLNSVAQYFPSADYLAQVVEKALTLIAPGGYIFLGDIRSLPLLEVFHTSVQLQQGAASLSRKELQQLVQAHVAQEKELAIDPAFFDAVKQRWGYGGEDQRSRVRQVRIQLKRGHSANELTCFRYDVVLSTEPHCSIEEPFSGAGDVPGAGARPAPTEPGEQAAPQVLEKEWQRDKLTLEWVQSLLLETRPVALRIMDVPNARLAAAFRAWELLKSDDGPDTVEALREEAREHSQEEKGMEPEDFWELEGSLPYGVHVTWSASGRCQCFDVEFARNGGGAVEEEEDAPLSQQAGSVSRSTQREEAHILAWSPYTNNPLQEQMRQKLVPQLRDYLKEKLPAYMVPAAFVVLPALPLTPNGKIDRLALPMPGHTRTGLKKEYMAPRTQIEEKLAAVWGQILGLERVGMYDNFFDLGGNSLLIIRVVAKANKAGLNITTKQVFKHQTIAELAMAVGDVQILAEQGAVVGLTHSAPGQRFVLARSLLNPRYFNLAYFLDVQQALNPTYLQKAVQELVLYHDALRLRFAPQDAGLPAEELAGCRAPEQSWPLYTDAPGPDMAILRVDLAQLSEQDGVRAKLRTMRTLEASLDMFAGPLFKVVYFEGGPAQPCTVLLLGHYLVADIESWQILIGDLRSGYQQIAEKGTMSFPSKPTSFKQWTDRLHEYAQSPAAAQEFPYWLAMVGHEVTRLPRDYSEGINALGSSETIEVDLTLEETSILLHEALEYYHTQMDAVLLMAIAWAFGEWTGQRSLFASLFSHGREALFEDMDVSRTVGALATSFPMYVDATTARDEVDALKMVQENLKQIPLHGFGYGILRILSRSAEADTLRSLPEPEVVVNYIGEGFSEAPRSEVEVYGPFTGHYLDRQSDRIYTFQITGKILDGKLQVQWDYSENLHRRETVERVSNYTVRALQALIAQCQAQRVPR